MSVTLVRDRSTVGRKPKAEDDFTSLAEDFMLENREAFGHVRDTAILLDALSANTVRSMEKTEETRADLKRCALRLDAAQRDEAEAVALEAAALTGARAFLKELHAHHNHILLIADQHGIGHLFEEAGNE